MESPAALSGCAETGTLARSSCERDHPEQQRRPFAGDEKGAKALLAEIVLENPQGHWPSEAAVASRDRRGY
ncbi:hypothetical protein [Sphingopyxis sp.]|uniref:hypothetical protein n=1 Tax=Sphingopyxis sp. TaxID=1908224 RepID=UPI003D0ADCE3